MSSLQIIYICLFHFSRGYIKIDTHPKEKIRRCPQMAQLKPAYKRVLIKISGEALAG